MNQLEDQFNLQKFLWLQDAIIYDLQYFQYHFNFLELCRETTKIFMQMGGILKTAFQDIISKCNIIERNQRNFQNVHVSLIQYILLEKNMDVAKYNGENCDHLKGTEMDVYTDYESTARTVLRLMWFLDYVAVLLEKLIIKPNDSLGSICAEAYSIALAPHHPFAVRFAARTGMLVVGSRESLFKIIFQNNEDIYSTLQQCYNNFTKIKNRLWDLYKQEQLCDLP
ncbi:unnamed protein product [Paramecium primaurelia]|uniref:Glycolipid transfer protein domain-containing protein n=2 Tax=Paramecium TaxID=5884 RepID=A0A8S1TCJ7_9CILI|nr:unnamed protein product [Paramecium primaurelia]CAD8151931.1 unnamed protein product [Paramecium pentaurelia]